jgi:hypothetical protein
MHRTLHVRPYHVVTSSQERREQIRALSNVRSLDLSTSLSQLPMELLELLRVADRTFLPTSAKLKIADFVESNVGRLRAGEFIGKQGEASKLVYGEKGIGKSSTFMVLVPLLAAKHDNLVPIYVQYTGKSSEFEYPSVLLAQALGLKCDKITLTMCLEELEKRNQFAFIIADEIDNLYRSKQDENVRLGILDELAELGTHPSGRTYSVVCGSSSATPSLISKNAILDPCMVEEFPLVRNATSLNGSKYKSLRLSQCQEAAHDYVTITKAYGLSTRFAHGLYFLAGSNLRTVSSIAAAVKAGLKGSFELNQLIFPPSRWDNRADATRERCGSLIDAINDQLVALNYKLLKRVQGDVNVAKQIAWLDKLKPLRKEDLSRILNTLKNRGGMFQMTDINALVDKHYFSSPPELDLLFPAAPVHLLHHLPQFEFNRLHMRCYRFFCKRILRLPQISGRVVGDHLAEKVVDTILKSGNVVQIIDGVVS